MLRRPYPHSMTTALLSLFLACEATPTSPPTADSGAPASEAEPDCLSLTPTGIDFGDLAVLEGASATETLSLTSSCSTDRAIIDVSLSGDSAFLSGLSSGGLGLAAGGVLSIPIQYTPEDAGSDSASLTITTDDPGIATFTATMTGNGIAPALSVSPLTTEFSETLVGCEQRQTIALSSTGNDDLIIDDLTFSTASSSFMLEVGEAEALNGPLPWTLPPETSVAVDVAYAPLDEFSDSASLQIHSNDPVNPELLLTQTGSSVLVGETTDSFTQPSGLRSDILFAVDLSTSMGKIYRAFQEYFVHYLTTLASAGVDYRVAIVVQDSGQIYGSDAYIDASNVDEAESIAATMLSGSAGNYAEMAFTLMSNSLNNDASWLREDAQLHLVGFSDESEQSSGTYSDHVSEFQALKDNPSDVVVHGIGGDYPSGCVIASAYTGIYEATVVTGGAFLSICTKDWGSTMESLAAHNTGSLNDFSLTELPVVDSIVITADGIEVTSGWSYDEDTNSVVFVGDSAPAGGSLIEISYALQGDCEP